MITVGLTISFFSYLIASNEDSLVSLFGYLSLLSIGIPIIITSLLLFINIRKGERLDVMYKNWRPLILVISSIISPFLYIKFEAL
jgi:hypothetical protein